LREIDDDFGYGVRPRRSKVNIPAALNSIVSMARAHGTNVGADAMLVHVPSLPGRLQANPDCVHADSQQTPSAQKPP